MTDTIIYKGKHGEHSYELMTESLNGTRIREVRNLALRYPNLKNVWYGWSCNSATQKPPFVVKNAITVLNDIWNNITSLDG